MIQLEFFQDTFNLKLSNDNAIVVKVAIIANINIKEINIIKDRNETL